MTHRFNVNQFMEIALSGGTLKESFAALCGITVPPNARHIPVEELSGSSAMGEEGVFCKPCSAPMLPAKGGKYLCDPNGGGCGGYATDEDAEVVNILAFENFKKKFGVATAEAFYPNRK